MVRRESYINKLRELNYTFKSQQKRTHLWRKIGGTHCIFMPMKDLLDEDFVRSSLRQAGCQETEIEAFLAIAKN
jgi:hypothetical protein